MICLRGCLKLEKKVVIYSPETAPLFSLSYRLCLVLQLILLQVNGTKLQYQIGPLNQSGAVSGYKAEEFFL